MEFARVNAFQIYGDAAVQGGSATPAIQASVPASAARSTAPNTIPIPMLGGHAITVWVVGITIALVLLRLIYEFGE